MANTKKALLSKLKAQLKKKKHERAPTDVEVEAPGTVDALTSLENDRRLVLLSELQSMLESQASTQDMMDRVRRYMSYYPMDRAFHRLLPLLEHHRPQLLDFLQRQTFTADTVMQTIHDFAKSVFATTMEDEVQVLLRSIQTLPSRSPSALIELDPEVFEALQFMSSDIHASLLDGLIETIAQSPPSTLVAFRQAVNDYVFTHRYDGLLRTLSDANVEADEKQFLTTQFLQDQFEGIRSQQFHLQIMYLIHEKIAPYQSTLSSLLYRYLPDKKNIAPLKKFLELVLDVCIMGVPVSDLEKRFPTRASFLQFQQRVLPYLPERASNIIRERCREEFDQPYLYQHAHRVKWSTMRDLIEGYLANRLVPLEVRLYDALQKHSTERLEQILQYLHDTTDVDRGMLRTMLERYVATQPYKRQASLRALVGKPIPTIQSTLQDLATTGYLEEMEHLSPDLDIGKEPQDAEATTSTTYKNVLQQQSETIARIRPFLPAFDHVAIRPFGGRDNILRYMKDPTKPMTSISYAPVNDKFFEHLVDPKIAKSQHQTKFTMDGVSMVVANVTIHGEYVVQTEETWRQLVQYIQHQQKLETILHPLPYFTYFMGLPMSMHRQETIRILRERIQTSIGNALVRLDASFTTAIDRTELAVAMETSFYGHAQQTSQYVQGVSRMLTLMSLPPEWNGTFRRALMQGRLNIVRIGELFHQPPVMEALLLPEFECAQSIEHTDDVRVRAMVHKAFDQEMEMQTRRLLLDAYAIEFPMRRLPYLPMQWDRTVPSWKSFTIQDDSCVEARVSTVPKMWTDKYLLTVAPSATLFERAVVVVSPPVPDVPIDVPPPIMKDPLADFLEVALDTMDEL